ncbi:ATP-binding protein [Methylotetracoccus oryzae]|uniref:ATP-binding protein n=1 Tax=Methylotetracoccus oryzae TaxID=1919059 RepID=UPI001117B6B3|nr:ATP-binding protein [Methylotetracoccus oryzae]
MPQITPDRLLRLRELRPLKPPECRSDRGSAAFRSEDLFDLPGLASLTHIRCDPGEIVCREGQPGDSVYLLKTGTVAIIKGEVEAPVVLAHRGAGELIGEMAVLERLPRSATAIALEPTELQRLDRDEFLQILFQRGNVNMELLGRLSHRLRVTDEILGSTWDQAHGLTEEVSQLIADCDELRSQKRLWRQTLEMLLHDLRNPVHAISLSTTLLAEGVPGAVSEEQRTSLRSIEANCQHLAQLVDAIVELSQIEAKALQFRPAPTDLSAVVRTVLDRLRPLLDAAHLTVTLDFPEELPRPHVDPGLFERVISNILDNAVRFTPGGGHITLTASVELDDLRLAITDTGPGVPPEQRERIFGRFIRGDANEQGNRRGYGLGLNFCRLVVCAHGGHIWAESGPGDQGACFVITVPWR